MNDRSNPSNVVPFPKRRRPSPFDELTYKLVMERHARGELEPAVLAALLQGCGFNVEAPQ